MQEILKSKKLGRSSDTIASCNALHDVSVDVRTTTTIDCPKTIIILALKCLNSKVIAGNARMGRLQLLDYTIVKLIKV